MANAITVNHIKQTPSRFIVTGTIALSGSYVQQASGGEVLDFTKAVFPIGFSLPNFSGPDYLDVEGCNGYTYGQFEALPQAYPNQFQVPIRVSTTAATELGAGNYPAGVTGDTINFEAHFKKMA